MKRTIVGLFGTLDTPDVERARRCLPGPPGLEVLDPELALFASGGSRAGPDASVVCAVDGRLFELDPIREELGLPSEVPQDQVVALGYRAWGDRLLERLRGEFLVVVWDRSSRRGLIARDQLGARSLFFHSTGARLNFGSEIRDLLGSLRTQPGPDREAVSHFLTRNPLPPGATLYEGVRQLGPGQALALRDGGWSVEPYWRPRYAPSSTATREELAFDLRAHLERAVGRRVGKEGKTAVIMSGGLDSTAVAALAHRHAPERLGVYSGVFPGRPAMDESPWIDRMTSELDLDTARIEPEARGLLADALDHIDRWRVPSGSFGFWVHHLYSRAVKDGATYVMTGDVGDELCDFRQYLIADQLRRGRALAALRTARALPLMGDFPPWRPVLSALLRWGVAGALPYSSRGLGDRLGQRSNPVPEWLGPEARELVRRQWDPDAWKLQEGPLWWADVSDALMRRIQGLGLPDQVRREAERAGLESALPFLDLDVVNFSLSVPPELLLGPYLSKPLLRTAMTGLLPEPVRLRLFKTQFDELVIDAVDGPERPFITELLTARGAEVSSYVNADSLRSMVERPAEGSGSLGSVADRERARDLLRLASVECWLRSLSDDGFAQRSLASGSVPASPFFTRNGSPSSPRRTYAQSGKRPFGHRRTV